MLRHSKMIVQTCCFILLTTDHEAVGNGARLLSLHDEDGSMTPQPAARWEVHAGRAALTRCDEQNCLLDSQVLLRGSEPTISLNSREFGGMMNHKDSRRGSSKVVGHKKHDDEKPFKDARGEDGHRNTNPQWNTKLDMCSFLGGPYYMSKQHRQVKRRSQLSTFKAQWHTPGALSQSL